MIARGRPLLVRRGLAFIEPSQEMLDKFSARFLGGKPLGCDLERLLEEVDKVA